MTTTRTEPKRRLTCDQDMLAKLLFETQEKYEEFRRRYSERVKPILDQQALARALSEQRARNHFVMSYDN